MVPIPLSPELYARISSSLTGPTRRADLASLCLTSKALQHSAEPKLYETLAFGDAQTAYIACRTLIQNPRLALFVRTFWFSQDNSRSRHAVPLWPAVHAALRRMHNLESLGLFDTTMGNGWVLDPEAGNGEDDGIKFQLREAKLRFTWSASLARFLAGQRKLQILFTCDRYSDTEGDAGSGLDLPALEMFDGMLSVAAHLGASPMRHLQMAVDVEEVREFLGMLRGCLWKWRKTLRGVSIQDLPEQWVLGALAAVAETCPDLLHVGLFPLPLMNRHKLHRSLISMRYLRSIHVDITHWAPHHPAPPAQRALAAELRVFCPSIRHVVFWIHGTRFRWMFSGGAAQEWRSAMETGRYPPMDSSWCSV
ncbi:hypothetical protein Hypma_004824 [Hypsizygus marmoreus]|uniref:F-box domain-containing protein n=1 Tax=Hypsizygus marmoreus TaxID=39966 RepID=A0A369J4J6_HYPMA|nr:hypothetical protein Hypma_004824 [Hypsizygus marmoreus]